MAIKNVAKRHQAGATLLEIMMVLGIIAVIVIGALAFFQKASTSNKVQTEVKNLTALISGIEQMYSPQGSFAGVDNDAIWNANFVAEGMKGANAGDLLTQWKGDVAVTPTGTGDRDLQVVLNDIPSTPCMDFVAAIYKNFKSTKIGAAVAITPATASAVSDISTACNAADPVDITIVR